jgi:hypothetical protein
MAEEAPKMSQCSFTVGDPQTSRRDSPVHPKVK